MIVIHISTEFTGELPTNNFDHMELFCVWKRYTFINVYRQCISSINPRQSNLVGGLEHFLFFHILGIIIPNWLIFFRGVETTNQICNDRLQFGTTKTSHTITSTIRSRIIGLFAKLFNRAFNLELSIELSQQKTCWLIFSAGGTLKIFMSSMTYRIQVWNYHCFFT